MSIEGLQNQPSVVMQAFNSNTPRPRQAGLCEFNATLVCIGRSMSAKANRPCQKKETNQREWGDGLWVKHLLYSCEGLSFKSSACVQGQVR